MLPRNPGLTSSERLLGRFAARSFLKLWSHANLYRARAKELCDLLVVFDDDVLIFSDKVSEFSSGPLDLAWHRWKSRAIDKSVDQLLGAERWLRTQPDRVFVDAHCLQQFPLKIPTNARFHLICVAGGAADRCRSELGGSGSLSQTSDADPAKPFVVSIVRHDHVIHLLDEVTAPLVFSELDTAPDFISYLTAKETLILGHSLYSTGEENTLAAYLLGAGQRAHPRFPQVSGYDGQVVVFLSDLWDGLASEENYLKLKEANQLSAVWDGLIEMFSKHVLDGTMESDDVKGVAAHETILRVLARATRFERYALGRALHAFVAKPCPEDSFFLRCIRLPARPDTVYAFALIPPLPTHGSHEEYRRERQSVLRNYCLSIKSAHPEVLYVVGVASSPENARAEYSEDLCFIDARGWGPEEQSMAEDTRRETGLYIHTTLQHETNETYGALHLMSWHELSRC